MPSLTLRVAIEPEMCINNRNMPGQQPSVTQLSRTFTSLTFRLPPKKLIALIFINLIPTARQLLLI